MQTTPLGLKKPDLTDNADLTIFIGQNMDTLETLLNNKANSITGGATTILSSNLTANKALLSDANGKVASSNVTNTELGYLSGVTSAIQTQLNGKLPTVTTLGTSYDADTVVTSGFYRFSGTPVNTPSGMDWGQLIVSRGGDTVTQIITDYNSGNMYWRSGNPSQVGGVGTWKPWRKIWHDGNFTPSNYAPLASPTLTGTPLAPTPVTSDSSTKIATTAFVKNQNYVSATPLVTTKNTTANYWTKIASVSLTAMGQVAIGRFLISGGADGGATGTSPVANVFFRVAQVTAMATAPVVGIRLMENQNIDIANFKAVTATNTASSTVVDLYVQIVDVNEQFSIVPLTEIGSITFLESQGVVSALPTGTQTSAVFDTVDTAQLPLTTIFNNTNLTGTTNIQSLQVDGKTVLDLPSSNPSRGPFNPIWAAVRIGRKLYTDEEFEFGNNSVSAYNNSGGTGVVVTRIDMASAPNSTRKVLEIRHNGGATSPGLGGFLLQINSAINKTFIQVFRAKLPAGYSLVIAENTLGNNATSYWLTNTAGTGKWEEYIRISHCGDSGTFSSGGHVYVIGSPAPTSTTNLVWYLASATVFDVTDISGGANITIGTAAPVSPSPNDIWIDIN
jgi:hypothetical protein